MQPATNGVDLVIERWDGSQSDEDQRIKVVSVLICECSGCKHTSRRAPRTAARAAELLGEVCKSICPVAIAAG